MKIFLVFYLCTNWDKRLFVKNGSHLDDLVRSWNSKFVVLCEVTCQKLTTVINGCPPFTFPVFKLKKFPDNLHILGQLFYLEKIKILSEEDIWNIFASGRMMITYLSYSRAELLVQISQITSITKKKKAKTQKEHQTLELGYNMST